MRAGRDGSSDQIWEKLASEKKGELYEKEERESR